MLPRKNQFWLAIESSCSGWAILITLSPSQKIITLPGAGLKEATYTNPGSHPQGPRDFQDPLGLLCVPEGTAATPWTSVPPSFIEALQGARGLCTAPSGPHVGFMGPNESVCIGLIATQGDPYGSVWTSLGTLPWALTAGQAQFAGQRQPTGHPDWILLRLSAKPTGPLPRLMTF